MYPTPAPLTTGKLEADNPLLLAGLERAAELADIEVVRDRSEATLTLRSAGSGLPHPSLDIAIDFDHIIISMSRRPSPVLWTVIYDLVGHLTATVARLSNGSETSEHSE